MRKAQREIKNFNAIVDLLDRCQTIRLGLHDEVFPYVVPLSFGWEQIDGKLYLYFHCAKEGKKVDLIAKNNAVAIEADEFNGYVKTGQSITADYKSLIAYGYAEPIYGEEALHGLELLLRHCNANGYSVKNCVLTGLVAVYRIRVETVTGKSRFP